MAFSDFKTIAQVLRKYPLKLEQQRFLPDARLALPDWFVTNMNFALDRKGIYESEQFFRESFVYPSPSPRPNMFMHFLISPLSNVKRNSCCQPKASQQRLRQLYLRGVDEP